MPHVSRWLALFTTGLITACAGTPTHSQPAPTPSVAAEDPDPPARVARLNFLQESVSFQPAGTEDWVAAVLNRPLTTGDKLWSDADARAEVHAGSAVFRMARNTGFSFLNLDDSHVQIRFTAGTLNVHLRQLDEHDSYEIDTPNLSASLLRPGDYRFEVNDDGDRTIVKVLTGSVEITGESQAFTVQPQQEIVFTGTTHLTSDVQSLGAPDAFDSWCLERNRREDQVQAARYVSPEVVGYEDLDQYGTWRSVPDYGYVWTPTTVTVGWAPYRYGHWVWMSPWGWTWVDDAPWGFAPFHYGRWALVAGSWCWVPGPPRVRPVYAPALVAWVGGPRFSASISVGSGVAWFPLAPREPYVPAYHVSPVYVRNVNISNTTIVNNTYVTNVHNTTIQNIKYANQSAPGAVTAVPTNAFTTAQPVAKHAIAVSASEVATTPAATGAPAVPPAKQSVLGATSGVAANAPRPPARVDSRAVVAKTTPPPLPPTFEKQREAIRANGGHPLAMHEMATLQQGRSPSANVRMIAPAQHAESLRQPLATPVERGNAPAKAAASGTGPNTMKMDRPRDDRPPTAQIQRSATDTHSAAVANAAAHTPVPRRDHPSSAQGAHKESDGEREAHTASPPHPTPKPQPRVPEQHELQNHPHPEKHPNVPPRAENHKDEKQR